MTWTRLSRKQLRVFRWWAVEGDKYDAIICDGSIRSGKTLCMSASFVLWAMTFFDRKLFALCGKTVASLRRNVIVPLMTALDGICVIRERVTLGCLDVEYCGKTNRFYYFGGKDESSYALIQGVTLAGVLFDEVALMPQSFVNQATARCSVNGSKFWFNCNPESPAHWFKTEWIDRAGEKRALHLHFTMQDNPSLSAAVRERYERQYSGVFYDRYIRGLWVQAEGLVYTVFDAQRHVVESIPQNASDEYYISIDYGTANPCSMGLWRVDRLGHKAYRMAEYYHDGRQSGQLTDEEYYTELVQLAGSYPIRLVVVDPSAASFIECIRRHGKYRTRCAVNDVLDGIRVVSTMLGAMMVFFHFSCRDSIREFGLYSWDVKANEDKVIKAHDHAMDDIRYFCNTILAREFRWADWR